MIEPKKDRIRTIKVVVEAKVLEIYPGSRNKKQLAYDLEILRIILYSNLTGGGINTWVGGLTVKEIKAYSFKRLKIPK